MPRYRPGPTVVSQAFGIPKLGDTFSLGNDYDNRAVVTSKTVQQDESPFHWDVELTWGYPSGEQPSENADPLQEPPDISYGFQTRRIRIPGRYNQPGNPTSAKDYDRGIFAPNGELFDPPPEVDLAEPVLTITRNQQTISGLVLMALANAVDADAFQGAEPRQLKMNAPTASRKYDKLIGFYWQVSCSMAFRWETWDVFLLNRTYYYEGGLGGFFGTPWASTLYAKPKLTDREIPWSSP